MPKEIEVPQNHSTEDLSNKKISTSIVQSQNPESFLNSVYSTNRSVPSASTSVVDSQLVLNTPFQIEEKNKDELKISSSNWLQETSPPPPPPGVDSPPPPPPSSPPPQSPPPLPLDNSEELRNMPEDMDLENSDDSCSQPIISKDISYDFNQIHFSSQILSSSNDRAVSLVGASLNSVTCDDLNKISENLQTFPLTSSAVINTSSLLVGPVLTTALKDDAETPRTLATPDSPKQNSDLDFGQSSFTSSKSEDVKGKITPSTSGPIPKKEKRKTKLLPVMALKKKKIPLLVEKWRKIKEEQEKEDKIEHS